MSEWRKIHETDSKSTFAVIYNWAEVNFGGEIPSISIVSNTSILIFKLPCALELVVGMAFGIINERLSRCKSCKC